MLSKCCVAQAPETTPKQGLSRQALLTTQAACPHSHLGKGRHGVARLNDVHTRQHASQRVWPWLLSLLRLLSLLSLLLPLLLGCRAPQRRAHSLRLNPGITCPGGQRERCLPQHRCHCIWSEAHSTAVAAAHRAVEAQQQLACGAPEARGQAAMQLGRPQRALHGRPASRQEGSDEASWQA